MLNQVVESVKGPFSDMNIDDLLPILQKWQGMSSASAHGWICKLKAFLRWESGNKNDPRARKIRTGKYVSPVTLHDLLT